MKKICLFLLGCLFLIACKGSSPTTPTPPKNPPVINYFDAVPNPVEFQPSMKTTLIWDVSRATTVEIDQGIGTVEAVGTKEIILTQEMIFVLKAQNNDGVVTKNLTVSIQAAAYFELISYKKKKASWGDCMLTGIIKNTGTAPGYNVMITFQAYNSNNVIIDTANGFPADLGIIPIDTSAAFEAYFFNINDWAKIAKMEYTITWLTVSGLKMTQKGVVFYDQ